MGKLKVIGFAAVIISTVAKEVFATLARFKPEALKLKDDKGNTLFAAGVGNKGSFSSFGIVFDGADLEGKATLTLSVPYDVKPEDKEKWVKDNFGYALLNLNTLETQINTEMSVTAAEFSAMSSSISVE